jgi:uncharacterized protein YggE
MKKKIMLVFIMSIIAGVLSMGLLGCSTAAGANLAQTQQQGISVNGEGKVTVAPNIATLELGVPLKHQRLLQLSHKLRLP